MRKRHPLLWGLAGIVVLMLLGVSLFVLAARSGWLAPNDADLRARYALPNATFTAIDGEPIQYVDEGSGPAIVLLHGSYSSLLAWNDWTKALAAHYRIIRFDMPPMGLSGPDPGGHYNTERNLQIIDKLTASLGVDRFFLVATSSAGVTGAAYAARHSDKLTGLVLANIAVGPLNLDSDHYAPMFKAILMIDPWFKGWHMREFWRQVLLEDFADPDKVTPPLVAEWTDLNNRAQVMPRAPDTESFAALMARTPKDLPLITAPTLLLWSANDREVPLETVGQTALKLLAAEDKTLVVVPHCGHIMPVECGPESVALAQPFFDRLAAASRN